MRNLKSLTRRGSDVRNLEKFETTVREYHPDAIAHVQIDKAASLLTEQMSIIGCSLITYWLLLYPINHIQSLDKHS